MVQHFIVATPPPGGERRQHVRYPFRGKVTVSVAKLSPIEGKGIDISVSGLCLIAPQPLPEGPPCIIETDLWLQARRPFRFSAEAKITSCVFGNTGIRVGARFLSMQQEHREALEQFIKIHANLFQ